jgi:tRNA A-37 threonylcarbamoyl transferase component Bud32/ribosomal protein L40E
MICPNCQIENPEDSNFCRKCATSFIRPEDKLSISQAKTLLVPIKKLERGSIFAERYEVVEELGKGGMGIVYKVFDKKIKEIVALKLIKPEIDSDAKMIDRFRNEIKLARKISHRNVCRMYDLGEEGESHFITMEYVPGENLKSFIRRSEKLTIGKAISIANQVSEGLSEAHSLGVVHRDLKPQNIMIDKKGNARIMDYGLARSLQTEGITGTGFIIGTPEYMSPEQVDGQETDQRTDIYALGVILYEMVTGSLPFKGETPLSIAVKHKTDIPRNPREIDSQIPEALSHLILKCMEKGKEKRYQTADELRSELKNIEKGISTAERIVPERKPPVSKGRAEAFFNKKLLVPVFVLSVLGMMFIIVWRLIPQKEEAAPQKEAIKVAKLPVPPEVKVVIPEIKKGIPKEIQDLLKIPKGETSDDMKLATKIIEQLAPEVIKFIKKEDLKIAESAMEKMKTMLPTEGPYLDLWKQIDEKIKEGKKYEEEGKIEEAQKSYEEGQTQMKELLDLVKDKEAADALRKMTNDTKQQVIETQPSRRENLLYRAAVAKEKDAVDAYNKNDFAGAKTLYKILLRLFNLSMYCSGDKECIEILQKSIGATKKEAEDINAAQLAPWYYERAKENEVRANTFLEKKEYGKAIEYYIQAAFLYEKAIEKATSLNAH